MKKLAIIGASYLQLPLIQKAKKMGLETHVFAWACNDVGEKEADYFYPISIVEKDNILNKCKDIGIDGIASIATDLGIITVNYVAQNMGLVSNSLDCTLKSTNKNLMRKCFKENGDPSPKSICIGSIDDLDVDNLEFPIIVKPLDRSGSRGITKLESKEGLKEAIESAIKEGFEKKVLVEEFAEGDEYSVECISWNGEHQFITITKKYTTGSPSFIETGHLEPSLLPKETEERVIEVVKHALTSLDIKYGASHSELKIDKDGKIKLIEIGGRMGGDFIGSNLVSLSTGYDFVKNVINVSLGIKPEEVKHTLNNYSAVRFVFNGNDKELIRNYIIKYKDIVFDYSIHEQEIEEDVTDSSNRHGYAIISSKDFKDVECLLPQKEGC